VAAAGDAIGAEELLVPTGRVPATADLGLEIIGLEPGVWLETDDTLRVPMRAAPYRVSVRKPQPLPLSAGAEPGPRPSA
jgi:hypothetical protein